MILYKTCEICGLTIIHPDFLKAEDGSAKYYASKRFHTDLTEDLLFCGAAHSTEWHQTKIDNQQKTS